MLGTGLFNAAVLTGKVAAGKTVICTCWIAAMSAALRPGAVGAFSVLALKAKPAPETASSMGALFVIMAAPSAVPSVPDMIDAASAVDAAPVGVCESADGAPKAVPGDVLAAAGAWPNKF